MKCSYLIQIDSDTRQVVVLDVDDVEGLNNLTSVCTDIGSHLFGYPYVVGVVMGVVVSSEEEYNKVVQVEVEDRKVFFNQPSGSVSFSDHTDWRSLYNGYRTLYEKVNSMYEESLLKVPAIVEPDVSEVGDVWALTSSKEGCPVLLGKKNDVGWYNLEETGYEDLDYFNMSELAVNGYSFERKIK